MAQIINLVRDLIKQSASQQMSINEIMKAAQKNRTHAIGQLDRQELVDTVNYYKGLQVLFVDENENILFL